MKKSQKNKKEEKQPDIDPKELMKDTEDLFKFVDKFESLDLAKANLNNLTKEINDIKDLFMKKYEKHVEDKSIFEEDLDTED
tara:strand:+ start:429 stop:674 length:246 start_codon:yes stop_codon:yes gene_type:complete